MFYILSPAESIGMAPKNIVIINIWKHLALWPTKSFIFFDIETISNRKRIHWSICITMESVAHNLF